jgi:hypothetical protein
MGEPAHERLDHAVSQGIERIAEPWPADFDVARRVPIFEGGNDRRELTSLDSALEQAQVQRLLEATTRRAA